MVKRTGSVISGSGRFIPPQVVANEDFLSNTFFGADGKQLEKSNSDILSQFHQVTTIKERRHVQGNMVTSDIATIAAEDAIVSSGIDREKINYILVAHNFGDVKPGSNRTDMVPTIASRVKSRLGIQNPETIACDVAFGCPGWLQAAIQADCLIRAGEAEHVLVVGAEVLSRVSDPHDRDSLLYSDGAGAVIFSRKDSEVRTGFLSHVSRSDTLNHSRLLKMDQSYNPELSDSGNIYLKMNGRGVYQYASEIVPGAIKDCLDKAGVKLKEVKYLLMHQANGKLNEAILKRLLQICDMDEEADEAFMPMTVSTLGNSSVATVPTLIDLVMKGESGGRTIEPGDKVILASVGAGMNANVILYQHS